MWKHRTQKPETEKYTDINNDIKVLRFKQRNKEYKH